MSSSGASRGGGLTQGTVAARPANPQSGQMYFATDTGELFLGNAAGNAWQSLGKTSALFSVLGLGVGAPGRAVSAGTIQAGVEIRSEGLLVANDLSNNIAMQTDVDVSAVGHGLKVAEGANAKQGAYGALVAGTLAVANTSVTANSRIFVCRSAGGTNPGAHYVSAQTAGTGFTVTSTNAADTGSGVFIIFEPG